MKISTQRWKGRLDAVIPTLPQIGISIQSGSTYNDLLNKILNSSVFNNQEKEAFKTLFINSLTETGERYDSDGDAIGRIDYEYIKVHFPNNIICKLVEHTDFAALYEVEIEQNRKKRLASRKRNIKIGGLVFVVLIIGIITYNLPYFAEKRAYARTIESPNIEEFNRYISKYDNEEHLPDVLYRKAICLLNSDDSCYYNPKAPERQCIEVLDTLMTLFPNNELGINAESTIDSIWTAEIEKFTQINNEIQSSRSLTAMFNMLNYMKENKVYDILLNIKSNVDLMEYTDFPSEVRDIMEDYFPELRTNSVLKIKDYFGAPDLENLENSLVSELSRSINSLFTPHFFSLIIKHNDNSDKSELPVIDLGYSIKTQTFDLGGIKLPSIWTYTSSPRHGAPAFLTSEKNIMGIEVSFDSKLEFPGQKDPWIVHIKGEPEGEINNIDDIKDGYKVMTRRCFSQFGDTLYNLLGLTPSNEK